MSMLGGAYQGSSYCYGSPRMTISSFFIWFENGMLNKLNTVRDQGALESESINAIKCITLTGFKSQSLTNSERNNVSSTFVYFRSETIFFYGICPAQPPSQ